MDTNVFAVGCSTGLFDHHGLTIARQTSNKDGIERPRFDDGHDIGEFTPANVGGIALRNVSIGVDDGIHRGSQFHYGRSRSHRNDWGGNGGCRSGTKETGIVVCTFVDAVGICKEVVVFLLHEAMGCSHGINNFTAENRNVGMKLLKGSKDGEGC